MNEKCEKCFKTFSNRKSLLCHQNRSKNCKKSEVVDEEKNKDELSRLTDERNKLFLQVKLEQFKNKIYTHLIKNNTSISIDDIFVEDGNNINVYNVENIYVYIHQNLRNEPGITIVEEKNINIINEKDKPSIIEKVSCVDNKEQNYISEDENKKCKKNYRSIKNYIDIVEESNKEEKDAHILNIDRNIKEKLKLLKKEEVSEQTFIDLFNSLNNSRTYNKILEEIKRKRNILFGSMTIKKYQEMLENHIKLLENIFRNKNYNEKKYTNIIYNGLSCLESRLIRYGNYTSTYLDIDDVQKLSFVLESHILWSKEYIPPDYNILYEHFFNYGTVLFPIKNILEKYLFNIYGFYNIIYLPLPKNTKDDPYSFYILEKVYKEKRYWRMDCRLENFTNNLSNNILPYMIDMFRKLYRDIFNDNDFRPNFIQHCQLAECDCEQLLQNIILMGQPKKFCNIIRFVVINKANYLPTCYDKFNMIGDDPLQRKHFLAKEEVDLVDILKQLFDGISSEEAVDFYRNRL